MDFKRKSEFLNVFTFFHFFSILQNFIRMAAMPFSCNRVCLSRSIYLGFSQCSLWTMLVFRSPISIISCFCHFLQCNHCLLLLHTWKLNGYLLLFVFSITLTVTFSSVLMFLFNSMMLAVLNLNNIKMNGQHMHQRPCRYPSIGHRLKGNLS